MPLQSKSRQYAYLSVVQLELIKLMSFATMLQFDSPAFIWQKGLWKNELLNITNPSSQIHDKDLRNHFSSKLTYQIRQL